MTETLSPAKATIDVRVIAPRERHAVIFACFDQLQPGQALELVNDHDPRPLRFQFEDRAGGQFEWNYLEAGPALWRVRIGRSAVAAVMPAGDSCCSGGACCG